MVAYSKDSARYVDIQTVGLVYEGVWALQWLVHYCHIALKHFATTTFYIISYSDYIIILTSYSTLYN